MIETLYPYIFLVGVLLALKSAGEAHKKADALKEAMEELLGHNELVAKAIDMNNILTLRMAQKMDMSVELNKTIH